MVRGIRFIESHLVWFVIVAAAAGLTFPETGRAVEPLISPLLALLMFVISLTFHTMYLCQLKYNKSSLFGLSDELTICSQIWLYF